MEVKRFIITLTENNSYLIWEAYEKGFIVIINEDEFIDAMDLLYGNPDKFMFFELLIMYSSEVFYEYLLPILKEETFICEKY